MIVSSRRWFYLATAIIGAALVYLLQPILTPFAVAGLLAYIGDPMVDRLERCRLGRRRLGRTVAVCAVFVIFLTVLLALALLLVPMLEQQIAALVRQVPRYLEWLETNLVPYLVRTFNLDPQAFGLAALKDLVTEDWGRAGGIAMVVLSDLSRSGVAILQWSVNLVLIPVVTFYMLRDWDTLVASAHRLLPRPIAPSAATIARECDRVLGEFLRGQLLVMLALAAMYWLGLWLVGVEIALLIALTAGLVSFVPYLGFIVGIAFALTVAFFQFDSMWPLVWVTAVFGIGQLLEGMVLTPLLVGERIGLHPVAVIFAVLAGGQLFGFVGVLLALPVAAVVVVVLRHAHNRYVESELYGPP